MESGKIILSTQHFELIVERLCHQLIENYQTFEDTALIGIQPRGVPLANRIYNRLKGLSKKDLPDYGKLDITFHRDDFRTRTIPIAANSTEIDFLVEDRRVILVDDVLYTGRTVVAALSALQHFGRPRQVELVTLVDRRFNRHLPIQADYIGITVDALDEAYVKVEWEEECDQDQVLLFPNR